MNAPDTLVADSASRLFSKNVTTATRVESEPLSRSFCREFTESGLDQVLALGGETRFHDAVSVLHAAGYHAVAAPIAEAVLARWLESEAGWPITEEIATVSLAAQPVALDARHGCAFERVPWGRDAATLYSIIRTPDGARIASIDTADAKVEWASNLAGEPRDRLTIASATAMHRSRSEIDADVVYALAALLRAAQMAGAIERVLEIAIEHANTRVQFGRPIGKFQAVQQMLAQLAAHAAAASAAANLGADGFAAGDGRFEAAVSKARAGEAAGFAAEIAHQVIGAMGYTLEHPLHRYTRRLWSWRDEYGNEAYWNTLLGDVVLASHESGVWPLIADRPWLVYGESA